MTPCAGDAGEELVGAVAVDRCVEDHADDIRGTKCLDAPDNLPDHLRLIVRPDLDRISEYRRSAIRGLLAGP